MATLLALFLLSGCSGDEAEDGEISATLDDYSITLNTSTSPSGSVTFDVENAATQIHEFVVARTDLAADALPTGDDGDVSEEGATDLEVIDEIEDVEPGATEQLDVTLEPGDYVLFCNLPGHYRQGMTTEFTVS